MTTEGPQHANIPGAASPFKLPQCVALDAENRVYIADTYNNRIRRLEPDGTAIMIAGTGERMYKDGPGHEAGFSRPRGTVIDRNGDILVADSLNHCIRRICARTSVVSTVAGTGDEGYVLPFDLASWMREGGAEDAWIESTDMIMSIFFSRSCTTCRYADGPSSAARFREPSGLAVDSAGNIVVADRGNGLVRLITTAGEVSTIAGHLMRPVLWADSANQFFHDAKGPHATFSRPTGIAVGEDGAVIVTDSHTDRVRKVALAPHSFSASYPAPHCFRIVRTPQTVFR